MAGRSRAGAIGTALLTLALVAGGSTTAFAEPPTPRPTPTSSGAAVSSGPSDQEVRAVAARVVALQRRAERTGEVAQKAGERALDAETAAATAAQRLVDARSVAASAAEIAQRSRARASAVAARLARADYGTLPLDLMLNGASAQGVLDGLSTSGQLSVQSRLLLDQATADQAEAERLERRAHGVAADAEEAAGRAAKAYAAAKRKAAVAKREVGSALAQQRALLATGGGGDDDADVCAAVGNAPVSACLPTAGVAPAGHSVGAEVVSFALAQIGKPYVFAAAGPDAYDCSGLTLAAYGKAGVSIGIHSATAQYRLAAKQGDLVPLEDAVPGDLLFYTDGGGDMYHVTIYAGNGLMIEAPYPGATVRGAPVRTNDLVGQVAHFG